MPKIFSIILIICGLIFFVACKNDPPTPPTADEQMMIDLAGEDYKDNIRLPVDPYGNVDTNQMAKIKFKNRSFDFDTIQTGDKVSHEFVFKNTGVKDLEILDTRTTCGCTISKHSSEPIPPGDEGFIEVSYDSKERKGVQEKIVRVFTNSYPNETLLTIKGFVNSPTQNK